VTAARSYGATTSIESCHPSVLLTPKKRRRRKQLQRALERATLLGARRLRFWRYYPRNAPGRLIAGMEELLPNKSHSMIRLSNLRVIIYSPWHPLDIASLDIAPLDYTRLLRLWACDLDVTNFCPSVGVLVARSPANLHTPFLLLCLVIQLALVSQCLPWTRAEVRRAPECEENR